jgi:hypothetical protein
VTFHWHWLVTATVVAVAAFGCAGNSGPLTRSGPPGQPPTSTRSSSGSATPAPTATGGRPRVAATPATGLISGEKLLVQASGFSPGEQLIVIQCASKGLATGPGDCNLAGSQSVTADSSGRVDVRFGVSKGPFGANKIICGASQRCLISVTQPTQSPTQEADVPITFKLPALDDDRAGRPKQHRLPRNGTSVDMRGRSADLHRACSPGAFGPDAVTLTCEVQAGKCHGHLDVSLPSPQPKSGGRL